MEDKLQRRLGFWDSIAINIGIVIGVGIFRVPAEVASFLDSAPLIILAWITGGLFSLLGVFCYGELSSCFPKTGGTYIYLREAYGKPLSFLFAWTEVSILRAGSLAGVAYIFAAYLGNFSSFSPLGEKAAAVLAILLFTSINVAGIHYGIGLQNFLSALKILTILGIGGAILWSLPQGTQEMASFPAQSGGLHGFGPALVVILWTYGGWEESTFMSGEFRDTKRALPHSLIMSILIITGLYTFLNFAYLYAMPPEEMKHASSIASDIFERLFGSPGKAVITAAVLASASGALNSYIMTGARIPYAAAHDVKSLGWLGEVHGQYATPARAFILNGVWASVLVLWGNFEDLLFFTGFSKWFFYVLIGVSVFILRGRAGAPEKQGFRMPGYPWVPALFTAASAALFITVILHAPGAALFGAGLMLAGLPVYYLLRGKAPRT